MIHALDHIVLTAKSPDAAVAGYEALLGRRADRDCVWGQYTVLVDRRDEVQAALKSRGIPTAIHYPQPIHRQAAYARFARNDLTESERVSARVLSLPMSADLREADQDRVIAALAEAVGRRA